MAKNLVIDEFRKQAPLTLVELVETDGAGGLPVDLQEVAEPPSDQMQILKEGSHQLVRRKSRTFCG